MGKRILTERRKKFLQLRVVEARHKVKERAVAYKGGRCMLCGFIGCGAAYDFHHPDPSQKDFGIGSGSYKSFERVRLELDKTLLLCANCHRTLHYEEYIKSFRLKKEEFLAEMPPRRGSPKKGEGPRAKIVVACRTCGSPIATTVAKAVKLMSCSKEGCCTAAKALARAAALGREPWPPDEELSSLVWQTSMLALGKRFGVSDVAVKKHCKKRGIPTPSIGYWSTARSKGSPVGSA